MITDKKKLRKADIITGLLVVCLGIFIFSESLTMPWEGKYGGVTTKWYESPGLLPMFISIALVIMGIILLINAAKALGLDGLREMRHDAAAFFKRIGSPSVKTIKFLSITGLLILYVYLFIPRMDFFVCTLLFLGAFTAFFYVDQEKLLLYGSLFFGGISMIILLYAATGLQKLVDEQLLYSMDIIGILFAVGLHLWVARQLQDKTEKKRHITAMLVSFIVPLILVPVFKYALLIPLPTEGLVIEEIFNSIRYQF